MNGDRYDNQFAEVYLSEDLVGQLWLQVQVFRSLFRSPTKVYHWLLVWLPDLNGETQYDEGGENDVDGLLQELDKDSFVLRAVNYRLRWLHGADLRNVKQAVFGL